MAMSMRRQERKEGANDTRSPGRDDDAENLIGPRAECQDAGLLRRMKEHESMQEDLLK